MTVEYKRMQQLRGSAADWVADNIVPLDGEIAVERGGGANPKIKLGDGAQPYSALPYLIPTPPTNPLGSINAVTTAPPGGAIAGDFWVNTGTGNILAAWGAPAAGLAAAPGDQLMRSPAGTWSLIPIGSNLAPYAKKADLAAPGGAGTIGTTGPSTVQADLNARPTSAALAASTGAGLVGWKQAGTGAVSRTVEGKLRERVSAEDFGAVADYNFTTGTGTDNTAAFTAAYAALGTRGGDVLCHGDYYVGGNLNVPDGVVHVGDGYCLGSYTPISMRALGTKIFHGPGSGIYLGNNAGFRGVSVWRAGLQFNITAAQVVSTFQGQGIYFQDNTTDQVLEDMSIFGFAWAALPLTVTTDYAVTFQRLAIKGRVAIDCINGIWLHNVSDIAKLDGLHLFPYVTLYSAAEANGAQLKRSGWAIYLSGLNDWTMVSHVFDYGHLKGFEVKDGASVTFLNCGADYPSQTAQDGSVGFGISGLANDVRLIACQVAQRDNCVLVNSAAVDQVACFLNGCNFWAHRVSGCMVSSGDVQIIGGSMRSDFAAANGVAVNVGAGKVNVIGVDFRKLTGGGAALSSGSTAIKLRHTRCTFQAVTSPTSNAYRPTVASAATMALNAEDLVFVVTGTTTITTLAWAADYAGKIVTLIFAGALTVTDGSNLQLAGNFVTTPDDTLTLASDGATWFEVARSVN